MNCQISLQETSSDCQAVCATKHHIKIYRGYAHIYNFSPSRTEGLGEERKALAQCRMIKLELFHF